MVVGLDEYMQLAWDSTNDKMAKYATLLDKYIIALVSIRISWVIDYTHCKLSHWIVSLKNSINEQWNIKK